MTVTKEMLAELSEAPLATLVKTNCTDVSAMWTVAAQAQREADIKFLAALSSRSAEAGKPVVKALEWRTTDDRHDAGSIVGRYTIEGRNPGYGLLVPAPVAVRLFIDLDAAKAAAQADYEARVRSALSTPADIEPTIRAAQITMGRGLVDVTRIEHEGRAGILFRPRAEHIPVGEDGELQAGDYWPVDGDVVIWIENEGGAKVVQNFLSPFLTARTPMKTTVCDEELWQLVPKEPTVKMISAGILAYDGKCESSYRAMLAAAPQPNPSAVDAEVEQLKSIIADCLKECNRSQRPSYAWQMRARAALAAQGEKQP